MREFTSKAELLAHYREVRARMRALKPPPPPPPPPPVLEAPPIIVAKPKLIPGPQMPANIAHAMILHTIMREVAQCYGVTRDQMRHPQRTKKLVEPRQIACYLLREVGRASLAKIGRMLDRDHTTALHGIERVAERMESDSEFAARVAMIADQIRERTGTSDAAVA